jgi:hypothetical protein
VCATTVANNVIVATKKVKKTVAKKLARNLSHHVPLQGGPLRFNAYVLYTEGVLHLLVVVLRTTRILGGFVFLLALTLILVNLQPASAQVPLQILITSVDAGSGTVSPVCPAPAGCNQNGNIGKVVTVTATPSSGWQFSSWSTQTGGSCIGGPAVNPCQVQMPGRGIFFTITIEATFIQVISPAVHATPVGGVMLPSVGFTALVPWAVLLSLLGVLSVEAFRVKRRAKRP